MAFLDLNLFDKQFVTLNSNVLIVIFSNFHFLLFYLTRITKVSRTNYKLSPHTSQVYYIGNLDLIKI